MGWFSLLGDAKCTVCPRGLFCPDPGSFPRNCPVGSISSFGSVNCTSCPAGFSCLNPGESPVACAQGQYSLDGDFRCFDCPAGFQCPSTSYEPSLCPSDYYSFAKSTACMKCPAGFACFSRSSSPIKCPSGTYSDEGDTECWDCPPGFECPSSELPPLRCLNGTFSTGRQFSCFLCPAGFACPNTSHLPSPCPPGTFSETGEVSCIPCTKGYFCPSQRSNHQIECEPGTYSPPESTSCMICPAGHACPSITLDSPIPCDDGKFAPVGSVECKLCPAGFSCTKDGVVRSCQLGEYSREEEYDCQQCDPGYKCSLDGNVTECPTGTYSFPGSIECRNCPPGWECPNPAVNDGSPFGSPCGTGSFSIGRQTSCTSCPEGYRCFSPQSNQMSLCSPGYISDEGMMDCESCPSGHECPTSLYQYNPCTEGTYAHAGSSQCLPCPRGYFCPSETAEPLPCPPGSFCPIGSPSENTCSDGYVCPGRSHEQRPPGGLCPIGRYCIEGISYPCPAGTFGNATGATSEEEGCRTCEAGFYCDPGSIFETMNRCPPGAFCPPGSQAPEPCQDGTFNEIPLATDETFCKPCVAGFYCPEGSRDLHRKCPTGHYCPSEAAAPVPCAPGTFSGLRSGLKSQDSCFNCTHGSYCPGDGTSFPIRCSPGTYNPLPGADSPSDCLECEPGWYCPRHGMSFMIHRCPPGHFCGLGQSSGTENPCPAGTFSDEFGNEDENKCIRCPERRSCREGTGGSVRPLVCPPGYFCPGGSDPDTKQLTPPFPNGPGVATFGCPPGTYSPFDNLASDDECLECPEGWYCEGANDQVSGPCATGHYCPRGTAHQEQNPCPHGTFTSETNLTHPEQCTVCPKGSFCPLGSSSPLACPSGFFSNITGVGADSETQHHCILCPAGYKCTGVDSFGEQGTVNPERCMTGFFSSPGEANCTVCPKGHFCDSNTTTKYQAENLNLCPEGLFCPEGLGKKPEFTNEPCISGHYCEKATQAPEPCPAGTYMPQSGAAKETDCITCPGGSYCETGSAKITGKCAPGYFCPSGSFSPTTQPCSAGFYRKLPGARNENDCGLCPSGSFCGNATAVPKPCPVGHYCVSGVSYPESCPPGTFNNITGVRRDEDCTECTPGYYCETAGLTAPTDKCFEGYYCFAGSSTPTPIDPSSPLSTIETPFGGLCPRGGFCPRGATRPEPCPSGSFSNVTGAASESQCLPCIPGSYCQGSSNPFPTGLCEAGFYCPEGSVSSREEITPAGYFTEDGSAAPIACPAGTWNQQTQQSFCQPCPERRYCPNSGLAAAATCPPGSFCPEGSVNPQPCPTGTFSDQTGLANVTECTPCPAGHYCESTNLTAPTGLCFKGYYCKGGASLPNPGLSYVSQDIGGPCPQGFFCRNGTQSPRSNPCPVGTYNPTLGAGSSSFCLPCPPGYFCSSSGLPSPSGGCSEGYFCSGGTVDAKPVDSTGGICPPGTFCNGTNAEPFTCREGTFTNTSGNAKCMLCPAGHFCLPSNPATPKLCPPGNFCPQGTGSDLRQCPPGTLNPTTGAESVQGCELCPAGKFCGSFGLAHPTGDCEGGFLCEDGAFDPQGRKVDGDTLVNITSSFPCPKGHYCPVGTEYPMPCPNGTFSNSFGNEAPSNCSLCTPGVVCQGKGLRKPNDVCAPGYQCFYGNDVPTPTTGLISINVTLLQPFGLERIFHEDFQDRRIIGGQKCPMGHFCPQGTSIASPCNAGTYSPSVGQYECNLCLAGYYCPIGSSASDLVCPIGHYCPPGTKSPIEFACPEGTYSNQTGLTNITQCQECPGGHFCSGVGLHVPSGLCNATFFCISGASTPVPTDGITGDKCVRGEFCREGSVLPEFCEPGKYCDDGGIRGECEAGFYCRQGSPISTPTVETNSRGSVGGICPRGFYCSKGSGAPMPCPVSTFSNSTGNEDISSCEDCTPGKICPIANLTEPLEDCPVGFFCPRGIGEVDENNLCPPAHFCPEGSITPMPCPPGTYQGSKGSSQCEQCPRGFFCPANSSSPQDCPMGSFCPIGTEFAEKYLCPNGTFSNRTNIATEAECRACLPGHYCDRKGLSYPSGICSEGFYCVSGSSTPAPVDGQNDGYTCNVFDCLLKNKEMILNSSVTGDICPAGHYCPAGSVFPRPCPSSTFRNVSFGTSTKDCFPCPPGYLCPKNATDVPVKSCPPGYFCPEGLAFVGEDQYCPAGHRCPSGTVSPIPCSFAEFQSSKGQSVCDECIAGYYCGEMATISPSACSLGHYCPQRSSSATEQQCPTGTFGNRTKLGDESECELCLPGKYCGEQGLSSISGDCASGYYCIRGSTTATPSETSVSDDGATIGGGICLPGTFCPAGAAAPLKCQPGTFSNASGTDQCEACTPGYVCDDTGLSRPRTLCPEGFFCPGGDSSPSLSCEPGHACPLGSERPVPCAAGSFQNSSQQANCEPCPLGFFCSHSTSEPSVCPKGFYCPKGTANGTQHACPLGTFSRRFGLSTSSECSQCPPGYFCGESALTSPSGLCGPGHFCTLGAQSPTPTDNKTGGFCAAGFVCEFGAWSATPIPNPNVSHFLQSGFPCPSGSFCPLGSSIAQACPPGLYQPSEGKSSCVDCPAGYFCTNKTVIPETCPLAHFCPPLTSSPIRCENGTFGNITALESVDQCAVCPPGKYCVDGTLTGDCFSGYYCVGGADNPWAGDCWVNHYCPKGAEIPIRCPSGSFTDSTSATKADDCGPCPAGFICIGDEPIECPRGHYCLAGGDKRECPRFTFNPDRRGTEISDCRVCGEGFFCNDTAISNPSLYSCPAGSYCPFNTKEPIPCPSGSFGNKTGLRDVSECMHCPAGYFCRRGSVIPTYCNAGYFCPGGSSNMTECPGGFYCGPSSSSPTICPPGFFCEEMSTSPVLCPDRHFCPRGSSFPLTCPPGTFTRDDTSNDTRTSFDMACEFCPPGEFTDQSGQPECELCTPGFVCLGGTSSATPNNRETDRGYRCPKGHYCPLGSPRERPCPQGTFNGFLEQVNISSCLNCRNNSYTFLEGQQACRPCGSSAFTEDAGSTTCLCIGESRHFQVSDGKCICRPGYEFVNDQGEVLSDQDDDVDCQPKNFAWCSSEEFRNSDGDCVKPSCDSEKYCPSGNGGSFDSSSGVCVCDGEPRREDVCDDDCLDRQIKVLVDASGKLNVTDPQSGITKQLEPGKDLPGLVGSFECFSFGSVANFGDENSRSRERMECNVHSMRVGKLSDEDFPGFTGMYGPAREILRVAFGDGNVTRLRSRQLQTDDLSGPEMRRPIVCISVGDNVVFELGEMNGRKSYPVYVKDSLLNTNPAFDYGKFRELKSVMQNSELAPSKGLFSFAFRETGIYVFATSVDADDRTIIKVTSSDEQCPDNIGRGAFHSTSSGNLVASGVRETQDPLLSPNWSLIGALIGGLLAFVLLLMGGIYGYRKKAWSEAGETEILAPTKKQSTTTSEDEDVEQDPEVVSADDDTAELKQLLEKMKHYHSSLMQACENQQGMADNVLSALQKEADDLRVKLAKLSIEHESQNSGKNNTVARRAAALRQLESELASRLLFFKHLHLRQNELIEKLKRMQIRLADDPSMAIFDELQSPINGVQNVNERLDYYRSLTPHQSDCLNNVCSSVYEIDDDISKLMSLEEREKMRRMNSLSLWKLGGEASVDETNDLLQEELNDLQSLTDTVDGWSSRFMNSLKELRRGLPVFTRNIESTVSLLAEEMTKAIEQRNPAIERRVGKQAYESMSDQFNKVEDKIASTLGELIRLRGNLSSCMENLQSELQRVIHDIRIESSGAERLASDSHLTNDKVLELISQIDVLVSGLRHTAQPYEYFDDTVEEITYESDDENRWLSDAYYDEANAAESLKSEKEQAELKERLDKDTTDLEEDYRQEWTEEKNQYEQSLIEEGIDEAQRKRLLEEFEKDQKSLIEALQKEKSRQAEALAAKFEERKQEKLAHKLRIRQNKLLQEVENKQNQELEEREKQAEEEVTVAKREFEEDFREKQFESPEDNIHSSLETEMERLIEEYHQNVSELSKALKNERNRQMQNLKENLEKKRRQKMRELEAKQQEELLAASSAEEREALTAKHEQEWSALNKEIENMVEKETNEREKQTNDKQEAHRKQILDVKESIRSKANSLVANAKHNAGQTLNEVMKQLEDEEQQKMKEVHADFDSKRNQCSTEPEKDDLEMARQSKMNEIHVKYTERKLIAECNLEDSIQNLEMKLQRFDIEIQVDEAYMNHEKEAQKLRNEMEKDKIRQMDKLERKLARKRQQRQQALLTQQANELNEASAEERETLKERHREQLDCLEDDVEANEKAEWENWQERFSESEGKLEEKIKNLFSNCEQDVENLKGRIKKEKERQQHQLRQKLNERKAKQLKKLQDQKETEKASVVSPEGQQEIESRYREVEHQVETLNETDETLENVLDEPFAVHERIRQLRLEQESENKKLQHSKLREIRRQKAETENRLERRRMLKQLQALQRQAEYGDQSSREERLAEAKNVIQDCDEEDLYERQRLALQLRKNESLYQAYEQKTEIDLDDELAKIREEYFENSQKKSRKEDSEKVRQRNIMHERLRHRRARKLAQLRRDQENKAIDSLKNQYEQISSKEAFRIAEDDNTWEDRVAEQVQKLASEHVISDDYSDSRDQDEDYHSRLLEEQQEEANEDQKEAAEQQELYWEKKLAEKRDEYATLFDQASEEELDRLKQQCDEELCQLEQKKETERGRQQNRLRKRLEARRKRKERVQKRQKEQNRQSERTEPPQESERDRTKRMISEILETELKRDPSLENKKGEIVERILQEKHDAQRNEKVAQQYREKTQAMKDTLQELQYSKQEEREDVVDKVENGSIPPQLLDEKLQEINEKYDRKQEDAQNDVSERMDSKHAEELLLLRRKQLSELHDMIEEFAPEDEVIRHETEKANREAGQLQEFQARLRKEKEERISKIKEERRKAEEEIRKKNEEQIQKLEEQMKEEQRRHEMKVKKQKEEMDARIEKERKQREEESAQLDEHEKERIMKQFEEERKEEEQRKDKERQRQYEKMQRKLAERRAKLKDQRKKEIDQSRKTMGEKEKQAQKSTEQLLKSSAARKSEQLKRKLSSRRNIRSIAEEPSRDSWKVHESKPAMHLQLQSMTRKLQQLESTIEKLFEQISRGTTSSEEGTVQKVETTRRLEISVNSIDLVDQSQLTENERQRLNLLKSMLAAVLGESSSSEISVKIVNQRQKFAQKVTLAEQFSWDRKLQELYIPKKVLASIGECCAMVNSFCSHYALDPLNANAKKTDEYYEELMRCIRITSQYLNSNAFVGKSQSWIPSAKSQKSLLSRASTLRNVLQSQKEETTDQLSSSEDDEEEDVTQGEPVWTVGSLSDRVNSVLGEKPTLQQYLANLENEVLDSSENSADHTEGQDDDLEFPVSPGIRHHRQQSVDYYRRALQEDIRSLQNRISQVSEESVKNLDRRNAIEEEITAAKDQVASLEGETSESAKEEIERLQGKVSGLQKQLDKCRGQYEKLSDRMESLEEMLANRKARIEELDQQSLNQQYQTITEETGGIAASETANL